MDIEKLLNQERILVLNGQFNGTDYLYLFLQDNVKNVIT